MRDDFEVIVTNTCRARLMESKRKWMPLILTTATLNQDLFFFFFFFFFLEEEEEEGGGGWSYVHIECICHEISCAHLCVSDVIFFSFFGGRGRRLRRRRVVGHLAIKTLLA